ncbi:MAG: helix-turn-helix domain containing protein [Patescibacteria group bacterium]|nr:helix-turn-helix domain containing protein [Patescibacteria group bacterium]
MPKFTDPKSKKCREVIRLKYEGESYAVISKLVNVSISTLKKWFMSGGLLKAEYEQYRDQTNKLVKEVADEILKQEVETAAKILVGLMGSKNDQIKFKAAVTIIEHVLGKPAKEELKYPQSSFNYESILRKARERQNQEKNELKTTVGN